MALYIGLMSGTSMDGVDAVLADFPDPSDSRVPPAGHRPGVRGHVHQALPGALADELLALNAPGNDELHRAAIAANELMACYAAAVDALLVQCGVTRAVVKALGAHGQTVRHRPRIDGRPGYTLQLAQGAQLAERCGIDVVCDFRSRDVAAGGQGAPLVPAFHAALFAVRDQNVAVLNVGGIANVTLLAANGDVAGHDTGPGNVLMDLWARRRWGLPFDRDGAIAALGRVDADLLGRLIDDAYFRLPPPKSTGRDLFHDAWLDERLGDAAALDAHDVMATLAELSARTAADAIRPLGPSALHVCGGGVANAHLMHRLAALLPGVTVGSTAAQGVPPQQVEALAFAWLAWAFTHRRAGNLPAVTGAAGPRVLGALYPA